MHEEIRVSKKVIEDLKKECASLRGELDVLARLRVQVSGMERRLTELLESWEEKTPVRPPSQAEMKAAFKAADRFEMPTPGEEPKKK